MVASSHALGVISTDAFQHSATDPVGTDRHIFRDILAEIDRTFDVSEIYDLRECLSFISVRFFAIIIECCRFSNPGFMTQSNGAGSMKQNTSCNIQTLVTLRQTQNPKNITTSNQTLLLADATSPNSSKLFDSKLYLICLVNNSDIWYRSFGRD